MCQKIEKWYEGPYYCTAIFSKRRKVGAIAAVGILLMHSSASAVLARTPHTCPAPLTDAHQSSCFQQSSTNAARSICTQYASLPFKTSVTGDREPPGRYSTLIV